MCSTIQYYHTLMIFTGNDLYTLHYIHNSSAGPRKGKDLLPDIIQKAEKENDLFKIRFFNSNVYWFTKNWENFFL